MSLKKNLIYLMLTLIGSACAVNYVAINKLPTADEQCEILNKKRTATKSVKKRKNHKTVLSKNSPVTSKRKEFQLPSINDFAFPADTSIFSKLSEVATYNYSQPSIIPSKDLEEDNIPIPQMADVIKIKPVIKTTAEEASEKHEQNKSPFQSEYTLIPSLFGFSLISSFFLLGLFRNKSRQISEWGARNPWKTRGILTGMHLASALGIVTLGNQMASEGVFLSQEFIISSLAIGGTAILFYPSNNSRINFLQGSYFRRKLHDTALFVSGTALVLSFSNHYKSADSYLNFIPETQLTASTSANFFVDVADDVQQEQPEKKKNTGVKILLLLLAVTAFLGLSFLLAGLACTIACNGAETLAAIVFFGGEVGLIALLVVAIKRIFGKKKKKQEATETEPELTFNY